MNQTNNEAEDEELLPEYDFSQGVRGKHFREMAAGYTVTVRHADGSTTTRIVTPESGVIILEPDLREYFPDSESVNQVLRSLIALVPQKPTT